MEIETIRPQAGRFEKQQRGLAHIVPLLLRSFYDTRSRYSLQAAKVYKNRPGRPGGFDKTHGMLFCGGVVTLRTLRDGG